MKQSGVGKKRKVITQGPRSTAAQQRVSRPQAQPIVRYQTITMQPRMSGMMENRTFDAVAAPVAIANCFSNAGPVAGTPFAPVAATSAWVLNQVPQGNSSITRVGRRLACSAINLRGQIVPGSTGTLCNAALILVWDRNPNQAAAIPAFNTVLSAQSPVALTNKDNAPRFKILRRWNFPVQGNLATIITNQSMIYFDEFVQLKNKVTQFTAADTTGLLPNIVEGALYLYALGDTAAGTTSASLTLQTRLYFKDQ